MSIKTISIYGSSPSNNDKTWHGTTWLELEVPDEIYQKIEKLIEKKISDFEKKCPCDYCKEDREEKAPE